VLFGAAAVLLIEDRFARHLLDAWHAGQSSLYDEASALTRRTLAGPHSI
jgi:hypothetical protein